MARRAALGARPRRSRAGTWPRHRLAAAAQIPFSLAQGGARRGSTVCPALHRIQPRLSTTDSAMGRAIRQRRPCGTCIAAARSKPWLCCVPAGPRHAWSISTIYALRAAVLVALIATGFCRRPRKICARRRGFRLALRRLAAQGLQDRRLDRSSSLYRQTAARAEPRRQTPKPTTNRSPQAVRSSSFMRRAVILTWR